MDNTNKTWITNCSVCNTELSYSSRSNLNRAIKLGHMCSSCAKKGIRHPIYGKESPKKGRYSKSVGEAIINGSIWLNSNDNVWYRKCPKCKKNIKASAPNRALKRILCLCYSCVAKNRKYSKECREKMKVSAIERIKKYGGVSAFNKTACLFIEDYGKQHGYVFQHALNGGEVWLDGFCMDGYDKQKQIAFEYDEPRHEHGKCKFLDLGRTKKLFQSGNVTEIIRYSQKYNKLYKSFPTYSIPL